MKYREAWRAGVHAVTVGYVLACEQQTKMPLEIKRCLLKTANGAPQNPGVGRPKATGLLPRPGAAFMLSEPFGLQVTPLALFCKACHWFL